MEDRRISACVKRWSGMWDRVLPGGVRGFDLHKRHEAALSTDLHETGHVKPTTVTVKDVRLNHKALRLVMISAQVILYAHHDQGCGAARNWKTGSKVACHR